MGGLCQTPVRRATGRAGLSVALYPPRRHRQQPADRLRPERCHLPMEGLPCQWSRSSESHDTRYRRVHPQIPDPRPAVMASTASDTTDCSPAARAPTTLPSACRLLDVPAEQHEAGDDRRAEDAKLSHPCPCCGGRMVIIETFQRGASPRYRPAASTAVIRIDTS